MPLVFDQRNLLTEGVHDANVDEIRLAFGGTGRRSKLCDNLTQYIADVKATAWACDVLIDGSFVMPSVAEPNDIDVILVLPGDWDLTRRDFRPFEYNTLDRASAKREYRIEVYPVVPGSPRHQYFLDFFAGIRIEWCDHFGLPREARKGIVRVVP